MGVLNWFRRRSSPFSATTAPEPDCTAGSGAPFLAWTTVHLLDRVLLVITPIGTFERTGPKMWVGHLSDMLDHEPQQIVDWLEDCAKDFFRKETL